MLAAALQEAVTVEITLVIIALLEAVTQVEWVAPAAVKNIHPPLLLRRVLRRIN